MPTTTRPARQTTQMLLERAALDFQAAAQRIADAAIADGEAPAGSHLMLDTPPPRWLITTPDITPTKEATDGQTQGAGSAANGIT